MIAPDRSHHAMHAERSDQRIDEVTVDVISYLDTWIVRGDTGPCAVPTFPDAPVITIRMSTFPCRYSVWFA